MSRVPASLAAALAAKAGVRIPRSSHLEDALAAQLRMARLPEPEREYVFARPRRWRFDFAWTAARVAVEVEGGIWVNGAHNRGKHFLSDAEKYNEAAVLGWTLIRVAEAHIKSGEALRWIERALVSATAVRGS